MQVAVFREGFVAPDAIDGNSQELCVEFLELGENFVVQSHLIAAHGTPVRGIEGHDDGPATQFAEREALIGSDVKSELGSGSSGGQQFSHGNLLCMRIGGQGKF